MKTIALDEFGPVISDKEDGNKIYKLIKEVLTKDGQVEIDMSSIKSMATFCASQIFGTLYSELGSVSFFENVLIKNANNDVRTIIKIGIQHTISQTK